VTAQRDGQRQVCLEIENTSAQALRKAESFTATLNNKLFAGETSAVLQAIAKDEGVPIAGANPRSEVGSFLDNQPESARHLLHSRLTAARRN
jgi:hypothetical protein